MYWATTTFRVNPHPDLGPALKAWAEHIKIAHPKIHEVRCYKLKAGTEIVWQEGFADFHDYQHLIEEEDDVCETVMEAVFRHMVAGTRDGRIWSDGI